MSKNPQDKDRVPGGEGEDIEKMPRREGGEEKTGQQSTKQGWNKEKGQGQQGQQGQQVDPLNPQKELEQTEPTKQRIPEEEKKKRPA